MNSCILTVIKNEHEYLDEWIKYHLNLGIDHIFIFEDTDSDSHEEITHKYSHVTLNSINITLNEECKKNASELKITKKRNAQEIYFPKALSWIKTTYPSYDWCFVIDCDEFITLERSNIHDILSLYNDYDAVILQWKIYGANGYVNKPDYKNRGIIDTYTRESPYIGHHVLEWTTKTCYNLRTFKETFFRGCHQPSDKCRWCKTDFSHSRSKIVYDNIYIRHYITKSWVEYIAKRKRGYFMGFARTTDMFFKVNPDMLSKKNELINMIKKETLVVLPYIQGRSQGDEIKLSLNGWKKFCQFDYHFIVIGEFDESLKNEFSWVEFIHCPTKEKKEGQYNPHLDIQNKFKVVMQMYSQIYDGFIYITDDEYAVKPFVLDDIMTTHYHSSSFNGTKNQPTWYWNHDKWKTRQLLDQEGLPHINYTTHYPAYFEFNKLKEIWNKFNMLNESYVFDDVYFNYFTQPKIVLDSSIRFGIWSKSLYHILFNKQINNPNIKFVCNSVDGWSKELENDLWKIIKDDY